MVEAPADSMIDQPQTSLTAVVTDDDPIATYEWTQTGGPPVTLNNADTDTLDVSDMATDESYTFQIFVVDADGQWDIDDVTVTTDPMFGGGESSDGGGESTSTGGGGAESTSRGEEESSGGGKGSATTSGGGQDTTEGEGESNPGTSAADTTAGDDVDPSDTQNPTQNPNDSGSGALETSAGGMTGDSGDDSPGIDGDAGGCNCSLDDSSPQGWWAWAMVLVAIRRRRSA